MIFSLLHRRWFWCAVLLVLATGPVSTYFLADCQGPVNKANFDRVQLGMSQRGVMNYESADQKKQRNSRPAERNRKEPEKTCLE